MNCPNCNHLITEEDVFCPECGKEIVTEKESTTYAESTAPSDVEMITPAVTSSLKNNLQAFVGIAASIFVIILGIITLSGSFNTKVSINGNTSSGDTVDSSYSYYGGDAYTGIQHAASDASDNAAIAAENIVATNRILKDTANGYNAIQKSVSGAVGMLIISIGLLGGAYFAKDILKKES